MSNLNINHNSPIYLHFDSTMQDLNDDIHGQRNSNYLYRLDSESDGYDCNLFFSPQPQVMLSRILAAKPDDLKNTKIDLTFATDLNAKQFDEIKIPHNPDEIRSLRKIMLDLTISVNFHHNWKQTVDFDKLMRVLSTNKASDDLLRDLDTQYHVHGIKNVVDTVVSSIGYKKARVLIPQAYKITNLACFWLDGFQLLKSELDQRGLTNEDFNTMNFNHKNKQFKRFEK